MTNILQAETYISSSAKLIHFLLTYYNIIYYINQTRIKFILQIYIMNQVKRNAHWSEPFHWHCQYWLAQCRTIKLKIINRYKLIYTNKSSYKKQTEQVNCPFNHFWLTGWFKMIMAVNVQRFFNLLCTICELIVNNFMEDCSNKVYI